METVLVAINSRDSNLWACIHALNLAKRTGARVSVLLVRQPGFGTPTGSTRTNQTDALRRRLESLIEEARLENISVDYYVANGNYETELLNFVREKSIALLILEAPRKQEMGRDTFPDFLEKIRHRITCRIEVVHERAESPNRSGKEKET